MKVLGAAFVTLMRMQSSNTPRLLCRESCSTRVRGKLAFAPTAAGRDGRPQHCECGSRLMQAKNR
jgi:hypothetical protein